MKQETLEEASERILLVEDLDLSDYDKRHILNAMVNIAKWQQEQESKEPKILENLLDENYDLNVQFHKSMRESIFCFAVAMYDEKLPLKEWEKKHYGNYIEQPKWQQEKSYSEIEGFINWIDKEEIPREDGLWIKYLNGKDTYLTTKQLFEKFKKK